jgi:hypothetical protein
MLALREAIMTIGLVLSGIGAFVLGLWAGSRSSGTKRFAGLVAVLPLVVPIYTCFLFLSIDEPGPNAFAWWLAGLSWFVLPWSIATLAGFALCAIRRRQRRS